MFIRITDAESAQLQPNILSLLPEDAPELRGVPHGTETLVVVKDPERRTWGIILASPGVTPRFFEIPMAQ